MSELSKAQIEALLELKKNLAAQQQRRLDDVKDRVAGNVFNEYGASPDDDSWAVPSDEEYRKVVRDKIAQNPYKMLETLQERLLHVLIPGEWTPYNNTKGPQGWESIQYLRQFPNLRSILIEDLRDQYVLRITDEEAVLKLQGAVMATITPHTGELPESILTVFTKMYCGSDSLRERLQ